MGLAYHCLLSTYTNGRLINQAMAEGSIQQRPEGVAYSQDYVYAGVSDEVALRTSAGDIWFNDYGLRRCNVVHIRRPQAGKAKNHRIWRAVQYRR